MGVLHVHTVGEQLRHLGGQGVLASQLAKISGRMFSW